MKYSLATDAQGLRATLSGRFTFQDHAVFRGLLGAIQAATIGPVTVDLGEVDFIDSAALGMLLVANDACRKAGLTLIAQHPKGQVRRTLEISAMGSIFQIQD
jgi:anti-anti-sigma factor